VPLPQGVSDYAVGESVSVGYGSSNQGLQGRMAGVNVSTVKGNDERGVDIADIKQRVTQVEEERIYQTVEQMPQFPGGESALMSSISQNLTYPPVAQENGIQGKVILRFKVEADGSISNITVVRSLDPACDKEAIRLVKLLPKFIPAKQNGINVAVWYTLPIAFKLE
jgi:protein TonB